MQEDKYEQLILDEVTAIRRQNIFIFLILGAVLWFLTAPAEGAGVKQCFDRSTYPPKVVTVCEHCQCPSGYYP